jgi:sigma-E factor negative regulatory protein RseC
VNQVHLKEIGEVIEVTGNVATIVVKRNASCEKCGVCGIGKKAEIVFQLPNELNAKVGDRVVLQMKSGTLFKAAFLIYTIPLIMLLGGFLLGQKIAIQIGYDAAFSENIGIFSGFIFLILTYSTIYCWDKKQSNSKFQPQIVKIASR